MAICRAEIIICVYLKSLSVDLCFNKSYKLKKNKYVYSDFEMKKKKKHILKLCGMPPRGRKYIALDIYIKKENVSMTLAFTFKKLGKEQPVYHFPQ